MIPILKGIGVTGALATAGAAEACAAGAPPDFALQPTKRRRSDAAPATALRVARNRVRGVRGRAPLMRRTSARGRGLPRCGEEHGFGHSKARLESTKGGTPLTRDCARFPEVAPP